MAYDAFTHGGFNSAMVGSAGNNRALQGMADMTMQAIQNENESRVAQAREQRRMEHERWKVQQQMALERYKAEQDAAQQIRQLRMLSSRSGGMQTKTMRKDPATGQYRFMEDWEG
jgi:hypothetical protein